MKKRRQKCDNLSFSKKKEVIERLDSGIITRMEVMEMYNIKSDNTVSNWRKEVERGVPSRHRYFPPELKIRVVNEILTGIVTKDQAIKEYALSSKHQIDSWIEKYRLSSEQIDISENMIDTSQSAKELELELHQARLKIFALEALISTAERELNYPIRKKYGTKQSEI